jgi:hypothetical protein
VINGAAGRSEANAAAALLARRDLLPLRPATELGLAAKRALRRCAQASHFLSVVADGPNSQRLQRLAARVEG